MRRFLEAFTLLAIAGPAVAQGSEGGLKPAPAAEIANAASSCMAAVRPSGLDESVLLAQGWLQATMTSKGKAVATPLKFYGRKAGNAILMTSTGSTEQDLCTVTARIERARGYAAVAEALTTDLKKPPFKSSPTESVWLIGQTAVQLAATGSESKPSVRVSVLHLAEKSK